LKPSSWPESVATYVVPVSYVYSDGALLGHSIAGLKLDMLRKNPQVCVEVDQVDDLANWRSVVAGGWFEELDGDEAESAVNVLMARFVPFHAERDQHAGAAPGIHDAGTGAGRTFILRVPDSAHRKDRALRANAVRLM